MVARERGETRLTHIAGNQLPADDELSGKFAWLEDGIDLDRDLRGAFLRLQITLGDMGRASILVFRLTLEAIKLCNCRIFGLLACL